MLVAGVLAAGLFSGCTSAQKGAAAVGAVGAGTGAILGNNYGVLNSWEGAGVGLATGGLVGALAGDAWDEVNRNQESEAASVRLQGYQSALANKEKTVSDMQSELDRLREELAKKPTEVVKEVKIESKDGQIRFTILNEVLFDSGKADLKKEGLASLDSVLELVQKEFPTQKIMIEGHTDNDPIKHSGWKSNWELSAARSLAVVHYVIEEKNVAPDKIAAGAFGEFSPEAANDSAANKRLNRRAVIVVLPPEGKIIVDRK